MTRLERYINTLNKAKNRTAVLLIQYSDYGDIFNGMTSRLSIGILIDGISVHNSTHKIDLDGDIRSQERKIMDRVLFSIFVKGLAHD